MNIVSMSRELNRAIVSGSVVMDNVKWERLHGGESARGHVDGIALKAHLTGEEGNNWHAWLRSEDTPHAERRNPA